MWMVYIVYMCMNKSVGNSAVEPLCNIIISAVVFMVVCSLSQIVVIMIRKQLLISFMFYC